MKRLLVALFIVAAIVLTLASPIFAATNSQNWKLDSLASALAPPVNAVPPPPPVPTVPPVFVMQDSSLFNGQSGFVQIPPGTAIMWATDVPTPGALTYPWGRWDVDLVTDQPFAANVLFHDSTIAGVPQYVQIGDYDPVNLIFSPFSMHSVTPIPGSFLPPAQETIDLDIEALAATVAAGHYLALRIVNPVLDFYQNPTQLATVFCSQQVDGSNLPSCITSPQTGPHYPTPELSAGILLGGGLLGLGGFVWARRKHSDTVI